MLRQVSICVGPNFRSRIICVVLSYVISFLVKITREVQILKLPSIDRLYNHYITLGMGKYIMKQKKLKQDRKIERRFVEMEGLVLSDLKMTFH